MAYLKGHLYLSKILVDSPNLTCAKNPRTSLNLPFKNHFCQNDLGPRRNDIIILGGPEPDYIIADGKEVTVTSNHFVEGVNSRKIGNTHEYSVLSDDITDIVGRFLLIIYKWTGFNFFGPSI